MKLLAAATKAGSKLQDNREETATCRAATRASMDALEDTLDQTEVSDDAAMVPVGETGEPVADDTYTATENNDTMPGTSSSSCAGAGIEPSDPKYVCKFCAKVYRDETKRNQHENASCKKKPSDQADVDALASALDVPISYPCTSCEWTTTRKSSLTKHLKKCGENPAKRQKITE